MNALLKKELSFLRLFLTTTNEQRKALTNTITGQQMKAVLQIVYNIALGNRALSDINKNKVRRYQSVIRKFIKKGTSMRVRRAILLKYTRIFVILVKTIQDEL